ncbi:hypothetical protein [Neptunicoccus sediminis]|uniref:hypothetical protein n=1 Tax=Neptunicoccus sediminis TaxID=1892596 RepID=UPI00084623A0|nr:hypothetical protein [Neptunicoccus sediminis]
MKLAGLFSLMIAGLLFAAEARALSCLRPNLAEAFNRFQDSEDTYIIALGKIRPTGTEPPYTEGKPRTIPAKLTGRFMGLDGFGADFTRELTIQTHCLAHWCGGLPATPNEDHLMFLRRTDAGLVLDMQACPDGTLSLPSEDRIDLLQSCLTRGKCTESDLQKMEDR